MICKICDKNKLSKEMLSEALTDKCKHAPLYCYRCVVKILPNTMKCPYPGCFQEMRETSDEKVEECKRILKLMFPEYAPTVEVQASQAKSFGQNIVITQLDGEQRTMPWKKSTTVTELNKWIEKNWGCRVQQQRLLFKEKELKQCKDDGSPAKLSDFDVRPGATISLLKLLYSIPLQLNRVIFELSWGYPKTGKDYLDASVLVFSGTERLGTMDYRSQNTFFRRAIRHHGDKMNDKMRRGWHTIEVFLHQFPPNVTHLFFTLSAWDSPTIAHYPRPSLRFYEASDNTKDLCNTTFTHAKYSQAVIMCSVSRKHGGPWQIFNSGKLSAGNAKNYTGINHTIINLIAQGI